MSGIQRWWALLGLVGLAGCAVEPPRTVAAPPPPPPPSTQVYFYPAQGRPAPSAEQQDRDRYECNTWAVQQSGFDPSQATVPPHERVVVVAQAPPPGSGVALGAVTGAVLGAAFSNPWHAGSGALIGALAGAAVGGAAEAEGTAEANRIEAQPVADNNGARAAAYERGAMNFRRAMSACLEARGYVVQ
jgi:hypothetical protein